LIDDGVVGKQYYSRNVSAMAVTGVPYPSSVQPTAAYHVAAIMDRVTASSVASSTGKSHHLARFAYRSSGTELGTPYPVAVSCLVAVVLVFVPLGR